LKSDIQQTPSLPQTAKDKTLDSEHCTCRKSMKHPWNDQKHHRDDVQDSKQ